MMAMTTASIEIFRQPVLLVHKQPSHLSYFAVVVSEVCDGRCILYG